MTLQTIIRMGASKYIQNSVKVDNLGGALSNPKLNPFNILGIFYINEFPPLWPVIY